jgi:hypothetical protein
MDRRSLWLGAAGLALLVAAMFAEALFAPGTRLLGTASGDLAFHTLPWREFGFGELAKGNLALWNPHVFAGGPFFGGMQSALLYPPNWLYLALPLPLANNWGVALNAWLLGLFMYLWALRRGLLPFAAFASAALLMFCAPHFLRVQAGLVTNLAAMAWVPLLFLAIDGWLESRRPGWCLLGALAVALQILAGQPQYVYYTGIVAAIYSVARLAAPGQQERLRSAAGLLAFPAGGVLLSAAQLVAGMQATAETVRDRALPQFFAASFNFPPENLLTLLVPGFFGDAATHPYWGRWYLWEACAFIGVTGLALAAYGIAVRRVPGKSALLAPAGAALLLALGDVTPLFGVLYEWLPLFDRFRSTGKFIFFVALFLALLAGYGLDRILRERAVAPRAAWATAGAALALYAASRALPSLDWRAIVDAAGASGAGTLNPALRAAPAFAAASQNFAAFGMLVAALTLAAAAGLAFLARRKPNAALLLGVLAVAEVFVHARMQRPTFDLAYVVIPQLREFLAANPGDYRILNLRAPNMAMSLGARDAWGYDPGVTRRYAELMQWSEGGDPAQATQYMEFRYFHPLLSMLRVKYIVRFEGNVMEIVPFPLAPLRRLELLGAYQLQSGRDAVLRAMGEPSFDPRREVILEQRPQPEPVAGTPGRATVLREGTDFLEVEAELPQPAVLLVTDAWSPGWRAVALGGERSYELMPANYALRAVALDRGSHRLRLEYAPAGLSAGAAVMALAWAAWIGAGLLLLRRAGRPANA